MVRSESFGCDLLRGVGQSSGSIYLISKRESGRPICQCTC